MSINLIKTGIFFLFVTSPYAFAASILSEEIVRHLCGDSLSFYNEKANSYAAGTYPLDMSHILTPFLERLPKGGKVLEVGVGSGRDAKFMIERGYQVTGIEGSSALAEIARHNLGIPIHEIRFFEEHSFLGEFDGLWSNATFHHVLPEGLSILIRHWAKALKKDGVIYTSFIYGDGVDVFEGRIFTKFTEDSFKKFASENLPEFQIVSLDVTVDRYRNQSSRWLNVTLKK